MQTIGRRNRAHLSGIALNVIDFKSPWVIACWSFFFPGFGHARLCKDITAWILIIWELVVNTMSHLNVAIMYTLTGHFELAKQSLERRLILLYLPLYMFAFWDSYLSAVEINKAYVLADREDAKLKPFHIDPFEINYLAKRSPILALLWSMFVPGLGQMMNKRMTSGIFLLALWLIIIYFSHGAEAIWFTLIGQFTHAVQILNVEWVLYLPSMYGYAAYDAYCTTIEYNKLFTKEQSQYLRKSYQDQQFPMFLQPTRSKQGE